jgi:hypothetical protein
MSMALWRASLASLSRPCFHASLPQPCFHTSISRPWFHTSISRPCFHAFLSWPCFHASLSWPRCGQRLVVALAQHYHNTLHNILSQSLLGGWSMHAKCENKLHQHELSFLYKMKALWRKHEQFVSPTIRT